MHEFARFEYLRPFLWQAREVSKDSVVSVMGQYRPEQPVNPPCSEDKYLDIKHSPFAEEIREVCIAARETGLRCFDECR